ncbi:cobyrinic acid a,c-diamide synthase [Paenibacillus sp. CAA11]|uniref:MinD/ParA family protein n=1 Tax=Paenibacillus sp. CAA11 TaxID=1532905 RepID=UPI000D394DF8|nr:MinD/ParA family protein [Paenibacillus sp. CAA11]AWB44313.1 cobyrinic acid a,c-diamide synthase [Paenibacillus sp. CAA11]
MSDQAQSLRQLVSAQEQSDIKKENRKRAARVITVTSGKGGVGKSNFTLNFALALQSLGKKVLVFDADIGMGNIDVLMGARPKYSLYHLLKGEKKLTEIVEYGADNLPFIAGGSGMADLFSLSESDLTYFTEQIEQISNEMDYILFDTGAGLSKETMKFIAAADECLVVTTPEPTSITDAYALIKVVLGVEPQSNFRLIVNRVSNAKEARQVHDKITLVAKKFLNIELPLLGSISDDPYVMQAVKRQVPFSTAYPHSSASRDIKLIAKLYADMNTKGKADEQESTLTGIRGFIHKWLSRAN